MKVIQVGIGGMGNAWLNAVNSSDVVQYAGFVEVSDKIADEQAEKYKLDRSLIFKSLPEALQTIKPDGVIDVTPPQFHKEVSLTALEAGIPVLSEKPLSNTLEDAQQIVDKANQTGVLHMVAQNYRYREPVQALKQVLSSGEMGAVAAVQVDFFKGPHFTGFRNEMDYPLIIDMSIHHFDMMRFLLDSDPVSIYGRSWNPSWSWYKGDASACVSLRFANDVAVTYNGTWCASGKETSWNANWRFDCEKGVVEMVDDVVRVHRWQSVDGFNNIYAEPEIVPLPQMTHTGQSYLLQEFYEAVTQGKQPATICQDNIRSLRTVFNIVQSFKTGQVIIER